ncbi:MAG: hypothetical protein WC889_17210 [Myxococcota bacterium]|jgi:hypothetical protein
MSRANPGFVSAKSAVLLFLFALALIAPDASAKPPANDLSAIPFPIRMVSAGTEMWALIDYNEAEVFNEGVRTHEKDRIRRDHDTSRSVKWQFSARYETFHFDGKNFSGLWRSPHFQDKYFNEFIRVDATLDDGGKAVRTMRLQKVRFDTTVNDDPLNRGYSVITLRFENLPGKATLGNQSIVYRFVPGVSKVFIEQAYGDQKKTSYQSKTDIKWKGLQVDDRPNPVTGKVPQANASIEFVSWGKSGPPAPAPALHVDTRKEITVKGNWKGLPEVIAWLSARPGLRIIDHTKKVADAVAQESELARSGLTDTAAGAAGKKESSPFVLEVVSSATDPKDLSAKATFTSYGKAVQLTMNLDYKNFVQFGDDALKDWSRDQTQAFQQEITDALIKAGL